MVLAILLVGCGSTEDGTSSSTGDTDSSTTSTTRVSEDATDTTSSTPSSDENDTGGADVHAIWPSANDDTIHDDPVAVARAFADEYLGFTRLVVGEFEPDVDGTSGRVPIRSFENGSATMVSVIRNDSGGGWLVLGAENEHLVVESPTTGAVITSPVTVSGQSTAFEGTVDIEIREDGRIDPLVSGFATGGANGEMGPFTTTIDLAEGGADHGALIVRTISMEDGGTQEATVIGVSFR